MTRGRRRQRGAAEVVDEGEELAGGVVADGAVSGGLGARLRAGTLWAALPVCRPLQPLQRREASREQIRHPSSSSGSSYGTSGSVRILIRRLLAIDMSRPCIEPLERRVVLSGDPLVGMMPLESLDWDPGSGQPAEDLPPGEEPTVLSPFNFGSRCSSSR